MSTKPNKRPYPQLFTNEEKAGILKMAEELWDDLQKNELGGFSGINRPFWIVGAFRDAIEKYGNRDTGRTWSYNDLKAAENTTHSKDEAAK